MYRNFTYVVSNGGELCSVFSVSETFTIYRLNCHYHDVIYLQGYPYVLHCVSLIIERYAARTIVFIVVLCVAWHCFKH